MEAAFVKKTPSSQTRRLDRFIYPRTSVSDMCRRQSLSRGDIVLPYKDHWYKENVLQKRFSTHLEGAFDIQAKVEPNQNRYVCNWSQDCSSIQPWPCVPRKKSYLSSADSVLDLPFYKFALLPELLDWSCDEILVAALGKRYYKWSWHTQRPLNRGITMDRVHTCKFDQTGQLLALGTEGRTLEIHNTELSKCLVESYCNCEKVVNHYCCITAIDWSPLGNSLVTGCSRGILTTHSRDAKVLKRRQISETCIMAVRISPDARYVAASSLAVNFVMVLTWHSLEPYHTIVSDWTVKTLVWHPWRSALLGIGAVTPELHTMVGLWDAPTAKPRRAFISHVPCRIDSMLFSHRTGEMVLSLWYNVERGCRIVVLSDPETVVDQWGEGNQYLDRVRTMVFSPDGTKLARAFGLLFPREGLGLVHNAGLLWTALGLWPSQEFFKPPEGIATATMAEDLIMWNFLPEDVRKKKYHMKKRRFCALPSYLDESLYGFSLR